LSRRPDEGALLSSQAVALTSIDVLLSNLTGHIVDVRREEAAGGLSRTELEAMRIQAARAWALLTVLSTIIFLIAPTLPMGLIALVAGVHVYRNWGSVKAGEDVHREGPIDNTNRLSALLITLAVLIAGGIGLSAMTLDPDKIRTTSEDGLTYIPGATKGPTISQP